MVWLHSAGATWAARQRWRGAAVRHAQQAGEPLGACAELLEQVPRGRVGFLDRATVLLGFPHVHYLMLPWQAGLNSAAEWQGFAQASFHQQAGLDVEQWQVQIANSTFGHERLAVAVSQALLQDLRELFKLHRLPLVTCTPLLTAVAQQYWRKLPDDCVLAVPEAEGLSCLYRQHGAPHQVCVLPTQPGSDLSDNLFTADLLAQQHAPTTLIVANRPTEHWLGPLHPWLEEKPA
ncbi:hypothetical protein DYL59_09660 [Pseudomonas kairouanensis]|uniref:Uncharacterized protein n=1 Tax=Pseudomonas kairouanensis TaxID=2293832 RepID=A0A4Z0AUM8_9PSED|nr:hypothetical protein DYL59_09660 [Pseudomonas kairouanensis]